ncbi:MAG: HEAT repeat domain-containing protein, partial [Planctomycetales bacterium]
MKLLFPRAVTFATVILFVALTNLVQAADDSDFQPPAIDVPDGFTLELVAGPPLVKHPMLAAFDDRGRLFVAETDGINLRKDDLMKTKNRFIRMLEDTDGDGKFDKSTIFADKMVMPEGALWHDGALYVISAPWLWKLEDTDDDGVADKRTKLVGEFELNGNPNLTGPYLGPCGRIYFTGGAFGYDLVDAGGRRLGKGNSAGVFSCRADGTDLQIHGQGTINPVEVMFSPEGELFTTVAIFDGNGGRHDALTHWIEGCLTTTVYGTPLLPKTEHPIPAVCRWGQVAPAGLMRYRNHAFSEDFHNNIFACQFNTHRVMRVELERQGASFVPTRDEPFITSTANDFHPTDIFEDADGSLLMIDTGGWVYYGCPTSKIAKPNIYGSIYRLRQKGARVIENPRGEELDWQNAPPTELVKWLDDPRPVVRDRSIATLARQGPRAVDALAETVKTDLSESRRRNAVWALSRIATPPALVALRTALVDASASVRQAAVRSLGAVKDSAATEQLSNILASDEPPAVRRAAASALSKIADNKAVDSLLGSLGREDNDNYLMHAQIYALIRINDFDATLPGLASENTKVQRSSLIALDQMADNRLTPELVVPLLGSTDQQLRTTAIDVITKHKSWADEIHAIARGWLASDELTEDDRGLVLAVLSTYADDNAIQQLMVEALDSPQTPPETRLMILDALAASNLKAMPDAFLNPLTEAVSKGIGYPPEPSAQQQEDNRVVERAIFALSVKDTDKLDPLLVTLSRESSQATPLRLAALAIASQHRTELAEPDFQLLTDQLDGEVLPVDRIRAAEALAAAKLTPSQTMVVAHLLESAGPLELPILLQRFERDAAPVVVNVDIQPPKGKTHRGVAAYLDEPQGHLATWNTWNPMSGKGFDYLRTSDGSFSGISVSEIAGADLLPYNINRFDRLMGDFVYSGLPSGGGKHQSFKNHFTIGGFKPDLKYDLYYYGSAYPKNNCRGADVTVISAGGSETKEIRGLRPENVRYEEGISHALFPQLGPREDGTVEVSWTSNRNDNEGNFGIING